jgi:hypothetical protein
VARPTSLKPGRKPGGRPSLATAPQGMCRPLSPWEVQHERVALCLDMCELVLQDEEAPLPPHVHSTIERLHRDLKAVWHELRQ